MNNCLTDYLSAYNKIASYKKNNIYSNENMRSVKIAILRTYSCEILEKLITVDAYEEGITAEIFLGGYNQINYEILDKNSGLYAFAPDIILLAIKIEDFAPNLLSASFNLQNIDESAVKEVENNLFTLIEKILSGTSSIIFITDFIRPYFLPVNFYENDNTGSMKNIICRLNQRLSYFAATFTRVHTISLNDIIYNIGASNSYDLKMLHIAKNPYTFAVYKEISGALISGILAVYGIRKKCIAIDLDNTLWKGIIGEDGIEGIEINESFKAMQRLLLYLNKTGILLAVNSKNNFDDAMDVINNHPDMVLRASDFSSIKINWNDKAANLKEIAGELNIGTESIIFIDDSEFECGLVNSVLPEIHTICLNGNYLSYPDIIKRLPYVNFVSLTNEDKIKKSQYFAQKQRMELKSNSISVEDYLLSLEIKVIIKEADEFSIPRISQLTQKTNQFNLTTKRYNQEQIKQMLIDGYRAFTVNDKDRFGDNGITGLIIVNTKYCNNNFKGAWFIDTFLLSCRVMNRGIERALLHHVIKTAKDENVSIIVGTYIETAKNKPVQRLYEQLGFKYENSLYIYDTKNSFECPKYIDII